ncbi:hypothetical protein [Gottfriedia acidiceleris]|uniref:hypothetical protein n=1 Tax=Gottfriedia acidiceleris TaxID=371036 RepID=UPI00142F5C9D|nr:hypothetical protein [Gottfriedia acidiceleris]
MSISQIAFMGAFYAIVDTILSNYIHWDNRYIHGIFGGLIILIGGILAGFIIKKG